MFGTKWFEGGWSYSWIGGTRGDSRSFVTRDVLRSRSSETLIVSRGVLTKRHFVLKSILRSRVKSAADKGLKPIA